MNLTEERIVRKISSIVDIIQNIKAYEHIYIANSHTLASITETSIPNDCNCLAAANPAIPAPITITLPFLISVKIYTLILI